MKKKRVLALLIALIMVFQMIPALTFAENEQGEQPQENGQNEVGGEGGQGEALQNQSEGASNELQPEGESGALRGESEPKGDGDTYGVIFDVTPAQATVSVYVKSEKPYSELTPLEKYDVLAVGDYHYIITADGYETAEKDFSIIKGDENPVKFEIKLQLRDPETQLYKARFLFNPSEAEESAVVEVQRIIDGEIMEPVEPNTTKYHLPNGRYSFTVSAWGYNTYDGTFDIQDADLDVPVTLTRAPHYRITYTVVPEGTAYDLSVYLYREDGNYTTPLDHNEELPAGTYRYVAIRRDNEQTKSGNFIVVDRDMEVVIDLTPVEAYAVYDGKGILHFYKDDQMLNHHGTGETIFYENGNLENMGITVPGWIRDETIRTAIVAVHFQSSFVNAQPQSMFRWFDGCTALGTVDGLPAFIEIENLDTSLVANFEATFRDCSGLTGTLSLTTFNTGTATNMRRMFSGCCNLSNLDLKSFNTASVTTMFEMFCGCTNLTELTLNGHSNSTFNTSSVDNMARMFMECRSLPTLFLGNVFTTGNVKDMHEMFSGCAALTSLDLTCFDDTSHVLYMNQMFYGCSALTSLNVTAFDTERVTTMEGMFMGCTSLPSLDISNFDTGSVTTMADMFRKCSSLESLDLSTETSFDTSSVTTMANMFMECSALESLDVSSFNTGLVSTMKCMFYGCAELPSLDVSNFNTAGVTDMHEMFKDCTALEILDLTSFNTARVTDMHEMFKGCSNMLKLYLDSFDLSSCTDARLMFHDCTCLHSIYVGSGFAFVEDVFRDGGGSDMFKNCLALVGGAGTVYDERYLDEERAIIDRAEQQNGELVHLLGYLTNWQDRDAENIYTSSAADPKKFLVDREGFEQVGFKLYVPLPANHYPNWTMQTGSSHDNIPELHETTSPYMDYTYFRGYAQQVGGSPLQSLSDPNIVNYAIFSVEPLTGLADWYVAPDDTLHLGKFENFPEDALAYGRDFDLSYNYPDELSLPYYEYKPYIDTVSIDYPLAPAYTSHWFSRCVCVSSFIHFDDIITNNTYGMGNMFKRCYAITSLDFSWFDTRNVLDMSSMFHNCNSLSQLDLSSFNTRNVTQMGSMFSGMTSLSSIDLSGFNTSSVQNMSSMFNNCTQLSSVDVSGFHTNLVENMSGMFRDCKTITVLDLLSFTTDLCTSTEYMFSGCTLLTTIYANDWAFPDGAATTGMFSNCTSLIGGNGTVFDGFYINGSRARIDYGVRIKGYFTGPYGIEYSYSHQKYLARSYYVDESGILFVDMGYDQSPDNSWNDFINFISTDLYYVDMYSGEMVTWDAPKCLADPYKDYVFAGYVPNRAGTTNYTVDYSFVTGEATHCEVRYLMFFPPEVFKVYVQFRRNPDDHSQTDMRLITSVAEEMSDDWTNNLAPNSFLGIGFLVYKYNPDATPERQWVQLPYYEPICDPTDNFYPEIYADIHATAYTSVTVDRFNSQISKRIGVETLQQIPDRYFSETNILYETPGARFYREAVYITKDGTRSRGPGSVFRVFTNNGVKMAAKEINWTASIPTNNIPPVVTLPED